MVTGKENVMSIFSEIFESIAAIEVNVSHIHEDIGGTLVCEMVITLDGEEILVTDIFEFDEDDQIKALRAYKGN